MVPVKDAVADASPPSAARFLSDDAGVAGPSEAALGDLLAVLRDRGYASAGIVPLPGKLTDLPLDLANLPRALAGRHNLYHRTAFVSLYRRIAGMRAPGAGDLAHFFLLGGTLSAERAGQLLGADLAARLVAHGILEDQGAGRLRSRVLVSPFEGRLYVSDPMWIRGDDEYVYMGRISFTLSEFVAADRAARGKSGGRLLDVGCGAGVIPLALAASFDQTIGVDIVPRAIRYSEVNARLGEVRNCSFRLADLYDGVDGRFDAVVSNTPSGWIDPAFEKPETFGTGGGDYGTALPLRILAGALERLAPGGLAYVIITAPVGRDGRYIEQALSRPADYVVHRLFEEYNYRRARLYRRHGIAAMVRYLVVAQPAATARIRFALHDPLRFWSYRLRAVPPRLAAALLGGGA
jgi:SAM-dependent methyltransferase